MSSDVAKPRAAGLYTTFILSYKRHLKLVERALKDEKVVLE